MNPDAHPAPGLHAVPANLVGGREGEFGDTVEPWGAGTRGHGRVRGRAGGCADGLAAWLLFVGGPWEYTTPVLLHFMHLGKNLRAGKPRQWNGLYLVRQDIYLVEQTGYVDRTGDHVL